MRRFCLLAAAAMGCNAETVGHGVVALAQQGGCGSGGGSTDLLKLIVCIGEVLGGRRRVIGDESSFFDDRRCIPGTLSPAFIKERAF